MSGDSGLYPKAGELEGELAARFGVEPARVLVSAGADEALDRVCRAFLNSSRVAVLTAPTFEMIRHYARLAGATIRDIPWYEGELDFDQLAEATRGISGICAIVSPNNPTGVVADAAMLVKLATERPDVVLVADFAYIEFADVDPTRELLQLPNVVVTRTFSKAWGIPGARVGYALGAASVIAAMRLAGGPYAVAKASLALALQRLRAGEDEMRAYVSHARDEVGMMSMLLRFHGIDVPVSQSNFVLMRGPDVPRIAEFLAEEGIGTRAFPNDPGLANARRMVMPAETATYARVVKTLEAALAEVQ